MNHTDLDTSRRLAKVWPLTGVRSGRWYIADGDLYTARHPLARTHKVGIVPAYDLSELEAEIWRM